MKISIVTVSYNQGRFIRQNIESALLQNHDNFEHIIIDGGLTDNTVSILKEYSHLTKKDNANLTASIKASRKSQGM